MDLTLDIQQGFWLSHLRIGFGVFLAETILVMVYLGFTPRGPHRGVLWVVVGIWFAVGLGNLLLAPFFARKQWRSLLSAIWTIVAAFAVGVVAYLDTGFDSPVLFLFFLPVAYSALAFAPVVSSLCGLATLVSAGFVVLTDSDVSYSQQGVVVLFGVLAGASVLSVTASVNRTHREQHERQLMQEVHRLAATDGLTGCAVHRVFHERLEEEIARSVRHDHRLSLLLIDVDRFKAVNDTYGHVVGDHVLAGIGAMLRANARSFDMVGRLGGDEFGVLMPDTEPAEAAAFAERIRQEVAVALEVPTTLSVGVTGLDPSTPTSEHMLDAADFALYQIKGAGRDGVAVRGPGAAIPKHHPEAERTSTP